MAFQRPVGWYSSEFAGFLHCVVFPRLNTFSVLLARKMHLVQSGASGIYNGAVYSNFLQNVSIYPYRPIFALFVRTKSTVLSM